MLEMKQTNFNRNMCSEILGSLGNFKAVLILNLNFQFKLSCVPRVNKTRNCNIQDLLTEIAITLLFRSGNRPYS